MTMALAFALGACSGGKGQGSLGGASGSGTGGAATGGAQGTGGQSGTGGAGSGGQIGTGGHATNPSGTGGIGSGGAAAGTGGTATGGVGTGGAVAGTGGTAAGTGGAMTGTGGATTSGTGGATMPGTGGATMSGTGGAPPTSMIVTSAEGAYWQTGTLTPASGTADVTVYSFQTFQTFAGFGGSFTERGWAALQALSSSDRDRAMKLLFGADGLRLAVGRIPIGATDYSLDRFSLDVTDSDTATDFALANFSLARDMQNMIPYVQAALDVNPALRLIADPWTPPVWMKTGPFSTSNTPSNYDGGNMKDDAQTLSAYALYLSKFVQGYAQQGIAIEAVAPQSDPTFPQTFPSCVWTPALYLMFVRDYLGPRFLADDVKARIMVGMLANGAMDEQFATSIMADPVAMSFITAFGVEDNMVNALPTLTSSGLPVFQTEQDPGNDPFQSGAQPQAMFSTIPANDYIFALQNWQQLSVWLNGGVASYLVKHMALDTLGANLDVSRLWPQDALLVVDTTAQTLTITPAFYVLRHLSQFVDPGAIRLGVQASGMMDPLAFRNPDGSIVTVLFNPGAAAQPVITVGGTTWQFSIPANGFATIVKAP